MRSDGREPGQLRKVKITPHFQAHPTGSCLIEVGNTRVICSAIIEDSIPHWMKGSGKGWLTAEYSMLPGSSGQRIVRERMKIGGRTQEIQRLIGRSLRTVINLKALGERTLMIDCDVLDADGGTRTAAITGSFVAVKLATQKLESKIPGLSKALTGSVAAVSVGMVKSEVLLDLDYSEDKVAEVDMNVVMHSDGRFIEVQGTAEAEPFDRNQLDRMLNVADSGIKQLMLIQSKLWNDQ